jgi:hypothetical protein
MIKQIIMFLCLILTSNVIKLNAVTIEDTLPEGKNATTSVVMTKNDIVQLIDKIAQEKAVSPHELYFIANCESSLNRYALNDNKPIEYSVGISQINLLAHPEVTREQAEDPVFSLNFMADNILKGKGKSMWVTCYKKLSTFEK